MRGTVPLLLTVLLAGCDSRPVKPIVPGDAFVPANNVGQGNAVVSSVETTRNATRPSLLPEPVPFRTVPAWDASKCGDDEYKNARMERHPALLGRSADDLLAAYGKAHTDDRFRAGDGVGTYSGGVASQLPGGAARNAQTRVREIIWQREGCNFIVRFRQDRGAWRVFDAFEASANADF